LRAFRAAKDEVGILHQNKQTRTFSSSMEGSGFLFVSAQKSREVNKKVNRGKNCEYILDLANCHSGMLPITETPK
jgi:hypothetical protein